MTPAAPALALATTTTLAASHKGGGAGAIVVFAAFVVAFLVLAVLVFRFTKQVERRRAEAAKRPGPRPER